MRRLPRSLSSVVKIATSMRALFYKLIPLISVFTCIFLMSGAVYVLVEPPIWFIPIGGRISFLAPYLDFQTVVEAVVVSMLILCGFLGLLLIQMSSKITHDPKYTNMLLAFGSILLIVSLLSLQYLFAKKVEWI